MSGRSPETNCRFMEGRSQRFLPGMEPPPDSTARTALEYAQQVEIGYGVDGRGCLVVSGEVVEPGTWGKKVDAEPVVEDMPF